VYPWDAQFAHPLFFAGSWWEGNIDPSAYSRALMYASRNSCTQMKREKELEPTSVSGGLAYLISLFWKLRALYNTPPLPLKRAQPTHTEQP
jgi:hypothetical protein